MVVCVYLEITVLVPVSFILRQFSKFVQAVCLTYLMFDMIYCILMFNLI